MTKTKQPESPYHTELAKLREQNRRLKAAILRARNCKRVYTSGKLWSKVYMNESDVLAALRLRK